MNINVVSQELFRDVIKTLPFSPEHVEVKLVPKKRIIPIGRRVIPRSEMRIRHDFSREGFYVDSIRYSPQDVTGAIRGGKVQNIEVYFNPRVAGVFEEFKESLLPELLNEGYNLFSGDLWASSSHSNEHYMEGDYRTGGLRFDSEYIFRGVRLDLSPRMDAGEAERINEWFGQLSKKYAAA